MCQEKCLVGAVETNTYWGFEPIIRPRQVPSTGKSTHVSCTNTPSFHKSEHFALSQVYHRDLPIGTRLMPALQRSCDGCVGVKRRCNLATPRCARCISKNITCVYINQPESAISNQSRAFDGAVQRYRPVRVAVGPSNSAFERGCSLDMHANIPEVIRSFSLDTLHQQLSILRSFAAKFAQHGAAPFLHPCLYESRLPQPLQQASRICASYELNDGVAASGKPGNIRAQTRQMLCLAPKVGSFSELLAYVQALSFLQIVCLLESQQDSEETDRDDKIFWELSLSLWKQAPVQLSRTLSPWRAWLFAESVRRTIIVCSIILAVRGALRRGYTTYLLCVEALPFDMRSQLWNSDTADAWELAASAYNEPSLVSLHRFTALQRSPQSTSSFESLVLLFSKHRDSSEVQISRSRFTQSNFC